MKKNIARISVFAVASLSLMLGGNSYNASVKEQVAETPVIIGKSIEHSVTGTKELAKGIAVEQVAQATEGQTPEETADAVTGGSEDTEDVGIEVKKAKVESNQVVANIESYLNIRAEASEEAEVVGKFYKGNVGTIVEKGDQWSVVASGNAYGYVKNEYLLFGADAEAYIENNCDQVAKVATETLNVRAEESTESDIITLANEGSALTILGQTGAWVKVAASEEVVGYVSKDYVYVDYVYETAVTIEEEAAAQAAAEAEAAAAVAQEQAQPAAEPQSPATESTQAPKEAPKEKKKEEKKTEKKEEKKEQPAAETDSSTGTTGQDIADYAVQFVGCPYKYGGTSLTKGADCSGFVQSVYKHFGYSLPRVAADQAGAGKTVKIDNLQPGDLIFYRGYGHVAIYIGGGQIVHASNEATGIKISAYDYASIDKAVRIVK